MSSLAPHEKTLVHRIRTLEKFLTRMAAVMAKDKLSLPLPEVQIIVALGVLGSAGVMEVSRYSHQDKSQTSRVIESLLERRLAKRRPNKKDARGYSVSLTAAGMAIFKKIPRVDAKLEAFAFSALDETELAELGKTVDKILDSHVWP